MIDLILFIAFFGSIAAAFAVGTYAGRKFKTTREFFDAAYARLFN